MIARCVSCKSKLVRGVYLDLETFEALKQGRAVEVCEVVRCLNCDKIAILWEDTPDFYENSERS